MYKAVFLEDGTRVSSYSLDLEYKNIPDNAIEISDEDQTLYATNEYLRGTDGKPMKKPPYIPTEGEELLSLRSKRNSLLADSDWTDTLSAKTRLGDYKYNTWQIYRQMLRDFPATCDPQNPVWPVQPE